MTLLPNSFARIIAVIAAVASESSRCAALFLLDALLTAAVAVRRKVR